jgi:hypothetical protein
MFFDPVGKDRLLGHYPGSPGPIKAGRGCDQSIEHEVKRANDLGAAIAAAYSGRIMHLAEPVVLIVSGGEDMVVNRFDVPDLTVLDDPPR